MQQSICGVTEQQGSNLQESELRRQPVSCIYSIPILPEPPKWYLRSSSVLITIKTKYQKISTKQHRSHQPTARVTLIYTSSPKAQL